MATSMTDFTDAEHKALMGVSKYGATVCHIRNADALAALHSKGLIEIDSTYYSLTDAGREMQKKVGGSKYKTEIEIYRDALIRIEKKLNKEIMNVQQPLTSDELHLLSIVKTALEEGAKKGGRL